MESPSDAVPDEGEVRPPRRLSPEARRWLDRTLALVLLAPMPLSAVFGLRWEWVVLGVLQIAPLWWRREHPVASWLAVVAATALQVPAADQPLWGQVAFPVAVYSIARFGPAVVGWVALAVGLVASFVAAYDWLAPFSPPRPGELVPYTVTLAAVVVAAWTLGTLGRVRSAYVEALLERNARVRHDAEQRVSLAATEERTRIAREMHDVVAHGLSVIIVQADGARYAAAADPEVATQALGTIARTGREALADMRRMLGLLRTGDTGTAPVPDLGDLHELVRTSGAFARLRGLERPVPGTVALTTYRVVQEALTNVRKHAGPDARPAVSVDVGEAAVEVEVRDHGRGASAPDDGRGHGLLGMGERVAALGGEVETGPAAGGGFRVWARIPV